MAKQTIVQKEAAAQRGIETRRRNRFMRTANVDSLEAVSIKSSLPVAVGDGWMNLLTGLGMSGYDKKESTSFYGDTRLYEAEIRDLITYNGLAKRIVGLMAEDMLREWFTIEGDTDNVVPNYYRKIKGRDGGNAKREIYRALKWARGYGGAIVVIGATDGQEMTEPLNEASIKKIEFIHAFHRYRVSRVKYYEDPRDPRYWETEIYMVNPPRGFGYQVHESRCLVFDGEEVPPETRLMNYGWGDSILQAVYRRLRGLGESYAGCEHIIQEFILTYLQISGLANQIASGQEELVRKRLNILDLSKHMMNTVLLDKDEILNRISASVAGLPELIGKLIQATASETGYPVRKLFGEVNVGSGLSNDRSEETRDYYDVVASEQEEKLLTPIERLSELIMLSKEGPTKGALVGSSWRVIFPPLWQPSEKEIVDNRKTVADTDNIYVSMGAVAPEEIRTSRFGGNSYSHETVLDPSLKPEDINAETDGDGDDLNKEGKEKETVPKKKE
jgi:phage-related protein (TIGR01555 family)